jgi:carbon monoxide dehydrogenase subunit G
VIAVAEIFTIQAPASEVWALFGDPAAVASCIPGATLTAADSGGFRRTMVVKFGPTALTFRGDATVTYDHNARVCRIEGRGVDQKGMSRAIASGEVSVCGNETADVSVQGNYNFTGPLEGFARSGGVHVVRAMIAEFAANAERLIRERQAREGDAAPAAESDEPAPSSIRPLSAASLLWLAFKSWFRQIQGKAP